MKLGLFVSVCLCLWCMSMVRSICGCLWLSVMSMVCVYICSGGHGSANSLTAN